MMTGRCCASEPAAQGISVLSCPIFQAKGVEWMKLWRMYAPEPEDYGMELDEDVLTAEEKAELAAESDEENARR